MDEWVAWFNHHRFKEPPGCMPPIEAEANHYMELRTAAAGLVLTQIKQPPRRPVRFRFFAGNRCA